MKEKVMTEGNDFAIIKVFSLRSDRHIDEQIVPLFDIEAVAGLVELFIEGHIPISEIKVPGMPPCDGGIKIKGDSMEPELKAGDIILYKMTQSRRGGLFFGEMYLLSFDIDGEEYITVKIVKESEDPSCYTLVSLNEKYAPKDIPRDSVRAMALVKGCIRLSKLG